MFIIYDLIFLVIAIFYLPVYLFKRKFHWGFLLRLGILPKDLRLDKPVWIHAVSVGEVMAVRGLLEELRRVYPEQGFVISTVTATGNKIAKSISKEKDFVTYLPLDFSFIIKCVIDKINPSLFIIVETEIWPNLLSYLYKKNIPCVVVNGRVSDRSFKGYLSVKFLLKSILNKINLFCTQTNRDAQRLLRLGVSKDKIKVTGNMKFDFKDYTDLKKDYTDYKLRLGLKSDEKIFVAASTHPGEEEIILGAYRELLNESLDLRLLVAPRHPERSTDIEKLIKKFGFTPMRISLLNSRTQEPSNLQTIFILDTVGELSRFYSISDIVFVGGSFARIGGHNILEPASLDKPVIFGPHMFNFRDISDLFISNQAVILVRNQDELKENIKDLLNNPSKMRQLCQRSGELIRRNQGATRKNIQYILGLK